MVNRGCDQGTEIVLATMHVGATMKDSIIRFQSEIDGNVLNTPIRWINKYRKTTGTPRTDRYPMKNQVSLRWIFKHDFPIGKACRERSRRSLVGISPGGIKLEAELWLRPDLLRISNRVFGNK